MRLTHAYETYHRATMSLLNMGILSGLQFPLCGIAERAVTGGVVRRLTDAEQIGAAGVAGVTSGVVCGPMELVMIQQQRFNTSLLGTPAKVVVEAGVVGLSRGLGMSCAR